MRPNPGPAAGRPARSRRGTASAVPCSCSPASSSCRCSSSAGTVSSPPTPSAPPATRWSLPSPRRAAPACPGEVSPPPLRRAGFERPVEAVAGEDPHPPAYVQTHGEAVVGGIGTCVECHDAGFCEACHFRSTYPHPKRWIEDHGPSQLDEGPDACALCHPQTFCAGCHGTEIPHRIGWRGEHWRDLQDAPVAACMLCHPKPDCTSCHTEHTVHREQDLYTEPPRCRAGDPRAGSSS